MARHSQLGSGMTSTRTLLGAIALLASLASSQLAIGDAVPVAVPVALPTPVYQPTTVPATRPMPISTPAPAPSGSSCASIGLGLLFFVILAGILTRFFARQQLRRSQ